MALSYGALVGLGFTWFEVSLYVVNVYAKIGVAAYGLQLGARYALFGLGGHALFTGLFGASLGSHFKLGADGCAFSLPYWGLRSPLRPTC